MDFTEIYYEQVYGCYPHQEEHQRIKTSKIFSYLKECLSTKEILKVIDSLNRNEDGYLKIEELPDWLWEGSLIERDKFYYHPSLQIRPKAPSFNPDTNKSSAETFYLEMKIKYTAEDLMHHVRKEMGFHSELMDNKRDLGSINHLLERYKKIGIVSSVDFVLYLIDYIKDNNLYVGTILDLSNFEREVLERCKRMVPELKLKKADQIVWR